MYLEIMDHYNMGVRKFSPMISCSLQFMSVAH